MADQFDALGFKSFDDLGFQPDDIPLEKTSSLGAVAAGAAKGATFGFDDEIAGIAGAVLKKTGSNDPKDFWDIYKNIRDDVRQYHKKAEEEHPVASLGGELTGGLVAGLALPIAPAAEGAGLLAKAVQLGKVGAAYGAASGLGGSEANLTPNDNVQAGQALGDIAKGAVTGAVTDASMRALGSTLKGAGNLVADTAMKFKLPQDIAKVAKYTWAGEDLVGQAENFNKTARNVAGNVIDDLKTLTDFAGAQKGQALQNLTDQGVKVKIGELSDNILGQLKDIKPTTDEEVDDIEKFKSAVERMVNNAQSQVNINPATDIESHINDLIEQGKPTDEILQSVAQMQLPGSNKPVAQATPIEIDKLIRSFRGGTESAESGIGKNVFGGFTQSLKSGLESAANDTPEGLSAYQDYTDANSALKNDLYKAAETLGISPKGYSAFEGADKETAVNRVWNMIQNYQDISSNDRVKLNQALDEIGQSNPGVASRLRQTINDSSEKLYLSQQLTKESGFQKNPVSLFAGTRSKILQGARIGTAVGREISNIPDQVSNKLIDVGTKLYDSSPEVIQRMADVVSGQGGAFGEVTSRALSSLANAPEAKRRAVLFTLMQQPDFREFANGFFGGNNGQ